MRPTRLELEGFTAFREPTVVAFAEAELFAITGPTGAGKSSLIDALTFALYGSIPRYDDRRLVAPVISQGAVEAKVRLDFELGAQSYTAVRVVRATRAGATTKEARLERDDGALLAGDADSLSAQVERLLGLSFDHFTTCVVLPQGEFARLLHAKPRDRQGLLVRLLELGLYERVAAAARYRAGEAANRAELVDEQLSRLAFATPESLRDAERRQRRLEELKRRCELAQPQLDALMREAEAAGQQVRMAEERTQLLAAIAPPDDLDQLTDDLDRAAAQQATARSREQDALAAVEAAERALAALPARAALDAAARDHSDAARLRARLDKGEQLMSEARAAVSTAEQRVEQARTRRAAAAEALEEARWAHRAHDLATRLELGEDCPVCGQPVQTLPDVAPGETARAQERLGDADRLASTAEGELAEATQRVARYEEQLDALRGQLATLVERLADHPPAAELSGLFDAVDAAGVRVDAARAARSQAVTARTGAERQLEALARRQEDARRAFDAARDRVAILDPPSPDRVSLTQDWQALLAWASERLPALRRAASEAAERREQLANARSELMKELVTACAEAGVDPDGRSIRDVVADAVYRADAERRRVAEAVEQAERLREEGTRQRERQRVAHDLGQHLSARNFEKWLLDEALLRLTRGATQVLHELSGGAYSLTLEGRSSNFAVVDHRNADASRSARTLSGGETFLTSLALALALADEVALLASGGAARLDAIFLDEGFGALDPATLDVVASAIEELGARRMVGVVTHVRELAERLPVRFEVHGGPAGASVSKVDV